MGRPLLPFQLARKPVTALPPADSDPFHASLVTVTVEPDWVSLPPQKAFATWPFGKDQVTVQEEMDDEPAVTLISPWKPPGH